MDLIRDVSGIRSLVHQWRSAGQRIGLVPTMGNLHAGHLALARHALACADRVVASVFVNPLQFAAGEDFADYPRTLDADVAQLEALGVNAVFAPGVQDMYPDGGEVMTRVRVGRLGDILCGVSRPGHFEGVATVVNLLFNLVQPDLAVFGEKDYQQLTIIRRMVRDLHMPVEVVGVPTVRESSGLAMSSRNQYLTAEQRQQAPALNAALAQAGQHIVRGGMPFDAIEREGESTLIEAGFRPDYFSVRNADTLDEPAAGDRRLVVLAAAWLGRARLIDNRRVERQV